MTPTGFILHPTLRLGADGRAIVQLFGRLGDGRPFLVEDDSYEPYFFIHPGAASRLRGARGVVRIESCALRDLAGASVARVVAHAPGNVRELRERLARAGEPAFEADIRFPYRYLTDRGVRVGIAIEGEERPRSEDGLVRFRNPVVSPAEVRPTLRMVSIDIETSMNADRVFSIALVGDGCDEVHVLSKGEVAGAVTHPDERTLLSAFAARIRALDPDVITGWNVVDFDVRVLVGRAEKLRASFQLGRVPGPVRLARDGSFTRQGRAEVPGRIVLDGMGLVRDAMIPLGSYSLESAAQSLLGRGKLVTGHDRGEEIQRMYREEPEKLVAYNREDAKLVLDILESENLLALCVERSLLGGMQLDRVGASIASFDRLYLPELRSRGYVAPCVEAERKTAPVAGGAVLESRPGVFRNVGVFDFKSLYPSLMRTFSLDPLAHARAGEGAITAPNGARFSPSDAILPDVLERFAARREAAKARGDRHADFAIKVAMNALFGVLGAASCRFFDPEIANAITSFGQQTLGWTREAFEACGKQTLYGDTDSVFVALDPDVDPETAAAQARSLLMKVQADIARRVREQYGVESRLVLELERLYSRFWMPRVRGGRAGSKKRYAGLVEDEVHVVGLESKRRDWPAVARRLQLGMLGRLFRDEPVVPFAKEIVERTLAGDLDAELVYRKALRKGGVERYKSVPPHVEAARRAGPRAGRIIEYVITYGGPEPVFEGEALPDRIDRAHYVEKVLRPIADAILPLVDSSFDAAVGAPEQLSLL